MFADAGEHVLQRAAFGGVVEDVADRDRRDFVFAGELGDAFDVALIVAAVGDAGGEPEAVGCDLAQAF